jgi:hypothetical protein
VRVDIANVCNPDVPTYSILALTPAGVKYVPQALRELVESLDSVQLIPAARAKAEQAQEALARPAGKGELGAALADF